MPSRQYMNLAAAPVMAVALLFGSACSGSSSTTAPAAAPTTAAQATSKPGGAQPAAAGAGDATRGQPLFASTCSTCHGPDAKGLPNLGKDLTTSTFVKSQTDPQLVDFVKKGRPASDPANTTHVDMPPRGGNPSLTDAQLGDIAAYVHTLNK
jgi:mono/diheme cytochrome c family protein